MQQNAELHRVGRVLFRWAVSSQQSALALALALFINLGRAPPELGILPAPLLRRKLSRAMSRLVIRFRGCGGRRLSSRNSAAFPFPPCLSSLHGVAPS